MQRNILLNEEQLQRGKVGLNPLGGGISCDGEKSLQDWCPFASDMFDFIQRQ